MIYCSCLTLQWKDTDSSLFCDCKSGVNHIFQVQLIAVLRTSLLNRAMFIQPTCSILPFLVKTSSKNHIIDMMLGKRIICCVNYTKTKVTFQNILKCVGLKSYLHPFDLQLQQNNWATEKDTDSKIKVSCANFVSPTSTRTLFALLKFVLMIYLINLLDTFMLEGIKRCSSNEMIVQSFMMQHLQFQ